MASSGNRRAVRRKDLREGISTRARRLRRRTQLLDFCSPGQGCRHVSDPRICPSNPNPCLRDELDAFGFCIYRSNGGPCTSTDQCRQGLCDQFENCVPTLPISCDDGNACTTDTFDPATGCLHTVDPPPRGRAP